MPQEYAITVEGLSKHYYIYDTPKDRLKQALARGKKQFYRTHAALSDVSFNVSKGETVGIIGRNGSGKSTLLQMISGTLSPTTGKVTLNGRVSALLELGAGFNPDFTGRENIFLNGTVLGLTEKEIRDNYDKIVEFSGLDSSTIAQPVKTYSSGMVVRLAFAVAVHTSPDILIVDEALSVGDEAFQQKCYTKIRTIKESGATILFVSHDTNTINRICDRAMLLEQGKLIALNIPKTIVSYYHKLIFAPVEKQPEILQEIAGIPTEPTATPQTAYVENLLTDSRLEYESLGVRIINPHIENAAGETVNLLNKNKTYYYVYDAQFEVDASNVGFGMMIKQQAGMDLGGAYTGNYGMNATLPSVSSGACFRVKFPFTATLAAGTYFMNCGCVGDVGNKTGAFLHRITDAVAFKVISDKDSYQTGIIDFNITPSVTPLLQSSKN